MLRGLRSRTRCRGDRSRPPLFGLAHVDPAEARQCRASCCARRRRRRARRRRLPASTDRADDPRPRDLQRRRDGRRPARRRCRGPDPSGVPTVGRPRRWCRPLEPKRVLDEAPVRVKNSGPVVLHRGHVSDGAHTARPVAAPAGMAVSGGDHPHIGAGAVLAAKAARAPGEPISHPVDGITGQRLVDEHQDRCRHPGHRTAPPRRGRPRRAGRRRRRRGASRRGPRR